MRNRQSPDRKRRLLKALIALLIGVGAAVGASFARGYAPGQPAYLALRYFSDGFFVAGLFIAGIGALVWIATTGFFDILSYGMKSLFVLFTSIKHPKEHPSYYDYKSEKDEHRGKADFTLLLVGALLLAASALCLLLYYRSLP